MHRKAIQVTSRRNSNIASTTTRDLKFKKSGHVCSVGVRDICGRKASPGAFSSSSKTILSSDRARADHWIGAGTGGSGSNTLV